MFSLPSKSPSSIDSLFCSPLRLAPDPFLFCLCQSLAAFDTHYYILIKTDSIDPAQSFFLIKDLEAQARLYCSNVILQSCLQREPVYGGQRRDTSVEQLLSTQLVACKENLNYCGVMVAFYDQFILSPTWDIYANPLDRNDYVYLNGHSQAIEIKCFTSSHIFLTEPFSCQFRKDTGVD